MLRLQRVKELKERQNGTKRALREGQDRAEDLSQNDEDETLCNKQTDIVMP